MAAKPPHIVFVFADQWRAQAAGYAGDPNAHTPHLDQLADESVRCPTAVSGCPVCSPYRASLLTGRYPQTHGVFVNDVCLNNDAVSLAQACAAAGYHTAYIGKWHLDGHGRRSYIPPERRQGFDLWEVLECTHDYQHSAYYAGNDPTPRYWPDYDAMAQTRRAQEYLRTCDRDQPFLLMLSWGPPHEPYQTAPEKYRRRFDPDKIQLRDNVPPECADQARRDLAGYYAHIAALDDCLGALLDTLERAHLANNTILVFTSDHGDMLGSHGHWKKQRPWDESIRVPLLLRYPTRFGPFALDCDAPIDAPDLMPTLLSLAGIDIPPTVEGLDFAAHLRGGPDPGDGAALLSCLHPFGQYNRRDHGGKEYRGLRTRRFTYVRHLDGPWLLYHNQNDPCQLHNLIDDTAFADEQKMLDNILQKKLRQRNDSFAAGQVYLDRWGYEVDETGTVPHD